MKKDTQKRGPGRPSFVEGKTRTARVTLAVLPSTKAAWQVKARASGLSLTAWLERAAWAV